MICLGAQGQSLKMQINDQWSGWTGKVILPQFVLAEQFSLTNNNAHSLPEKDLALTKAMPSGKQCQAGWHRYMAIGVFTLVDVVNKD